ncbi:MAG: Gfo/Idh/MocA family oxidoreductase [Ectobacillus sp.]
MKIKELLGSNAIGKVNFVVTTQYRPVREAEKDRQNPPWRVQPYLAGGGIFFNLASYTLDILDFLLGPIVKASGFASNQALGCSRMGTWCFFSFQDVDRNEIVGSKGKLVFSTFGDEPVRLITAAGTKE